MKRSGRAAGVRKPLTDAQKAVRQAQRTVNLAKQQATRTQLLKALRAAGVPLQDWTAEHDFYGDKKSHPWRFDLAEPRLKIAVEIDGGSWAGKPCPLCGQRPGGRHSHGAREAERLKLNTAQAFGWAVLSFTQTAVERRADECADLIARTYRLRYPEHT